LLDESRVISTGAQRSGEISVWMLFPGNVSDRLLVRLRRVRLRLLFVVVALAAE
jgi:hypothetical protein